jgi:hypothetical protein
MAITTCTITGNVKNLLGANVQSCTVRASILAPFFHTSSFISGEQASVTTDSSGNFSLDVIETESVGQMVSFSFEYNDGTGNIRRKSYSVVVPDDTSAVLSDLIAAAASPVTTNTFPASAVTVVATGNIQSTDAQAALEELQGDIDTLNALASGTIYLGNASNVATEVTPTGDVTISNSGVTSITPGVIINADINSAAAIARSKVATGTVNHVVVNDSSTGALSSTALTSGQVLLGNSSDVPTGTTVTGDVTISNAGVTAIASGVIVDADINASAAITRTKVAAGTVKHVVINDSTTGALSSTALTAGQVLIGNPSAVPTGTTVSGDVTINSAGVADIAAGVIINADIHASAAIARTKIASGTNYRILANDSSGVMSENAALTAKQLVKADANGQLTGITPSATANTTLISNGTDFVNTGPVITSGTYTQLRRT